MLETINKIINFIPKNSVKEMLNIKLYSIFENSLEEKPPSNIISKESFSEIEYKLKEYESKTYELKESNDPFELLDDILSNMYNDFKKGKNHNNRIKKPFDINKNNNNNLFSAYYSLFSFNNRIGGANVCLVPSYLYDNIKSYASSRNIELIINPLEKWNDKVIFLRKDKDFINHRYHLITNGNIPTDRRMKINKIIKKEKFNIKYLIVKTGNYNDNSLFVNVI